MMFRIEQLKLPITYTEQDLKAAICRELKIADQELLDYQIVRRSLDARKKTEIHYSFLVDARVSNEKKVQKLLSKLKRVSVSQETKYQYRICGMQKMTHRPIIVGLVRQDSSVRYFLQNADTDRCLLNVETQLKTGLRK